MPCGWTRAKCSACAAVGTHLPECSLTPPFPTASPPPASVQLSPECREPLIQEFNADPSPIGVLGSLFLADCAAVKEGGFAPAPAPAAANDTDTDMAM